MKKRSTKRALLLSALSLLMCVSMLIGSTFAWFTDSVTSAGNKIVSGSLKVDLEMYNKETKTWKSIKEHNDPIFTYEYWEPGYVDAKLLKVENEGNLALKWKAAFVSDVQLGILADVIDVFVKPGATEAEFESLSREDLATWTNAGTVREFLGGIEASTYGTLTPKGTAGATANLGIALKMRETAGNEYQEQTIGFFDIKILATQYTYEEDSFDEFYDKLADYDGEVSNAATLQAAFNAGGTYKIVSDFAIDANTSLSIPEGVSVTLDMNGKTITGGNDMNVLRKGIIVNNGNLTLGGGGEIKVTVDNAYSIIDNNGTLELYDVTLDSTESSNGIPMYAIRSMNNLVVNEGAVVNGLRTVTINDGTATFNGGEITTVAVDKAWTVHAVYVYGDSTATFNGGTFKNLIPASYASNAGAAVICDATTGAIVINGGYYESTVSAHMTLHDYGFGGPKILANGGTYKHKPASNNIAEGCVALENTDGTWTVVKGTPVNTPATLKETVKNGGDVILTDDIAIAGAVTVAPNGYTEAYGNKIGIAQYGGILDGNGKTLTDSEGDRSYLVVTHGGTIKNLTIKTGARGIVTYIPTENVYIDNVVVDGPGYALNSTEHGAVDMFVTNSTINGWTSLAGFNSVQFTNCKLGENSAKYWQNMGYGQDYDRLFRVYSPTTYTKCEFEQGYYLDLSAGGTATLIDCTTNGVEITAENYADYITIELPAGKTLSDCVFFG